MEKVNGNGCDEIIDDEIINYYVRPVDKIDGSLNVIKISKRFGGPLYQCFYIMSLDEIELFLRFTSFDENYKTWTWKELKKLTIEIIFDSYYASYEKYFSIDFNDSLEDEIISHHVNPKSRIGKSKKERSIRVRRSKRFEDFFHYCFWHMYISEIIYFLRIVFDTNSNEVWTWDKLQKLIKDIVDGYHNEYIYSEKKVISDLSLI
jgi:hypothetical protein